MVYFNCGGCGEALKKNQVEKHYSPQCRNCQVSCADCGTEFWGNDYQKHIKCISEEEKYSGKNYVPKINKGEAKQEQWIQQVQYAIGKCKCNPKVKKILVSLLDYPNIPRKKIKFENFLANSLRIHDKYLVSQVWDILMVEAKPVSNIEPGILEENGKQKNGVTNDEKVQEEAKLNKREKKEERQKKKKDKKHKNEISEETTEEKNKKRKQCTETEGDTNGEAHTNRKMKRKRKHVDVASDDSEKKEENRLEEVQECDEETDLPEQKRMKFNWEDVITQVLQKKGEISLKKLRKKVLSEFSAQGHVASSEEKLWSKFNKKVTKNPLFKIDKDKVKFTTQ